MAELFTEGEAVALRELVTRHQALDDSDFVGVSSRPILQLREIARRNAAVLRDPKVPVRELVSLLNATSSPVRRLPPPALSYPPDLALSACTTPLPPKIRGKPMAIARPPSAASPPGRLPLLPRIAPSPSAGRRANRAPEIGSLAAVLHPHLGPLHVCRVLGKHRQNDSEHFLVAFFQREHSPCLVPRECLFELQSRVGLPLGEESEFERGIADGEISVDWLLERVFVAAQVLAIDQADVLYPREQVSEGGIRPDGQQIQQRLFQCVSCAALLIVCYVLGKWRMPPGKMALLLSTILRASSAKFVTTQRIMEQIEKEVRGLLPQ
jgi:hypothetical protein